MDHSERLPEEGRMSDARTAHRTTEAMRAAARNRIARSIPAMLEGQRRARERRAAERHLAAQAAVSTLAGLDAVRLYRHERALAAERWARRGGPPCRTSGRCPHVRETVAS